MLGHSKTAQALRACFVGKEATAPYWPPHPTVLTEGLLSLVFFCFEPEKSFFTAVVTSTHAMNGNTLY